MNNAKKYAIVNDVDCPERRLVTQMVGGKHFYMARHEEGGILKRFDGMTPTQPTFIEDFGFKTEPVEGSNRIRFTKTKQSTATYRDGSLRRWQGETEFELPEVILSISEKKKFKIL